MDITDRHNHFLEKSNTVTAESMTAAAVAVMENVHHSQLAINSQNRTNLLHFLTFEMLSKWSVRQRTQ